MRDILITGGAGKIGYDLVLKLLDTRYSITILDLESRYSLKRLNNVRDKVKIVYGDIEDKNLVVDLVKRNDIVIDYAGVMPPIANLDDHIADSTNYIGTKNIVDAIKEVNPECILIYMSFLSIYGLSKKRIKRLTTGSEITYPDDLYSLSIVKSEDYIKDNLQRYTILRMPIVLTDNHYYLKHMKFDRTFDFITSHDLNSIVVGIIGNRRTYKKIYNLSGFKMNSTSFIEKMYEATGKINIMARTLYYGEYDDDDEISAFVKIKYTSDNSYFSILRNQTNRMKRLFLKTINFPKYLIYKYRNKK